MTTENDTRKHVADLYWLAFLLTGREDLSIEIASDAAVSTDHARPFFSDWMQGWQRRLVIGRALTAIQDELAESARRTQLATANASGGRRARLTGRSIPIRRKQTSSKLCSRSICFPAPYCYY